MALNPLTLVRRAWNAMRSQPVDPQRGSVLQFIGPNNARVPVTPEIALMSSAVWACIDCIAAAMASSDWNVYAGTRGMSDQQFLADDSLQYILNTRPNPEMTAQSGKRALMIAAAGWGNGYAEIVRDRAGRIAEVWPLAPDRCEQRRDHDTGELFLRVYNDWSGGYVELDMRDVFHVRGPGITGVLGDSPFARAVQTIAMSVALEQFAASYFANNTQMGVVLEYPGLGKMDDPTFERLKQSWENRHKGSRKAFRVGFLDGGMKLHQLLVEAEKAQLVDARYQQVEEICRWWRVPPHKVAHLLRSTNNNIEHQGLEFSRDTLRPWKVEIEQESDFKLIAARGPRKFVCIDLDWAAEGDFKSRMEGYQIGRAMGVYSGNDILRKLGENTIGKDGDIRIVQGAMIKLEDVGQAYAKPAPATQPTEEEEADDAASGDADDVMEAWVRSVYQRIKNRQDKRRADLIRGGRDNAERQAQLDAMAYIDEAVEDVLPAVRARFPGAANALAFHALEVVRGADPAVAAADLFKQLERTQ